MPDINANEVITQKHVRAFLQFGGARPSNPLRYGGQDAQYVIIDGVSIPEVGGIDPIYVPSPRRIGEYKLVGRSVTPADLPTATLTLREKHGPIPRQLFRSCAFNVYEVHGNCRDLSDFAAGWTSYVLIYAGAIVTEKDGGTRTGWDSDDGLEDGLSITLSSIYPVGALSFGEGAATQIDKEVTDVVYGSFAAQCGDCGVPNDGSQWMYAVTKSSGGSPGLPAEVVYSLDGGATWNQVNIDGFGAAEDPVAIDIVGTRLVVVGSGAYFWSDINILTGVPGAFTKVTTGFVAAKNPLDLYVAGPREIYFSGQGGYIYFTNDITSGVSVLNAGIASAQNLLRIHGNGDVIVAVGLSGAIVRSTNRGATWATTTSSPVALNGLTAVFVLDALRYWIGTDSGRLFYTLTGGELWYEKSFSGGGAGQVKDIVFATDEVGYFSHSTAVPRARVFATINGGADWGNGASRVNNMPTFNYADRIAVPDVTDPAVAANNVLVGGLAGNGVDGIVIAGIAAKL